MGTILLSPFFVAREHGLPDAPEKQEPEYI